MDFSLLLLLPELVQQVIVLIDDRSFSGLEVGLRVQGLHLVLLKRLLLDVHDVRDLVIGLRSLLMEPVSLSRLGFSLWKARVYFGQVLGGQPGISLDLHVLFDLVLRQVLLLNEQPGLLRRTQAPLVLVLFGVLRTQREEVLAAEVLLLVDLAFALHFLQNEVVAGGVVIVLVRVEIPHDLVPLEALLFQFLEDRLLVEHVRVPHDETLGSVDGLVSILEPRVRPDLRRRVSLFGVLNHDVFDQVPRVLRDETRNMILPLEDLLVELSRIGVLKRQEATDEREQYDAATPGIDLRADVLPARYHFGRRITRGSAGRFEGFLLCKGVRESEIDNLDILLMIQQQILRLQISVHYIKVMHILYARDDLLVKLAGLFLLEFGIFNYVVEELATAGIFHYEVKLFWSFYNLIQLNNIRVPYLLENMDFASNSLDVRGICYAVFFQYFDADFLASQGMGTKFDFTKGPFANRLFNYIVTDNPPLYVYSLLAGFFDRVNRLEVLAARLDNFSS